MLYNRDITNKKTKKKREDKIMNATTTNIINITRQLIRKDDKRHSQNIKIADEIKQQEDLERYKESIKQDNDKQYYYKVIQDENFQTKFVKTFKRPFTQREIREVMFEDKNERICSKSNSVNIFKDRRRLCNMYANHNFVNPDLLFIHKKVA